MVVYPNSTRSSCGLPQNALDLRPCLLNNKDTFENEESRNKRPCTESSMHGEESTPSTSPKLCLSKRIRVSYIHDIKGTT